MSVVILVGNNKKVWDLHSYIIVNFLLFGLYLVKKEAVAALSLGTQHLPIQPEDLL